MTSLPQIAEVLAQAGGLLIGAHYTQKCSNCYIVEIRRKSSPRAAFPIFWKFLLWSAQALRRKLMPYRFTKPMSAATAFSRSGSRSLRSL